jgi:hypothetical protein
VGATSVVVRTLSSGNESERILDALDAAVELPSDRLSTGRRYILSGRQQMDRARAVAALEAELDKISPTWSSHLAIRGIE